ncbi:MAG TPA: thioesterase domain-containing protein [Longimicrobiaceae bacterium]|jgi:thioesterase domain-containing protein|nr:thioesterase domain-containing protein [Longimicrobiaceae bacterium]
MRADDARTLEAYLHEHIPISQPLGIRVLEAGPDGIRLAAPLAPNLNHRQTAFGGSLSAVAILAAWSCLHLRLRTEGSDARVVIQSNSMEYLAPAEGDFVAVCRAPSAERWDLFRRTLERRGRARLALDAEVYVGERLVAQFHGQYVAILSHSAPTGR